MPTRLKFSAASLSLNLLNGCNPVWNEIKICAGHKHRLCFIFQRTQLISSSDAISTFLDQVFREIQLIEKSLHLSLQPFKIKAHVDDEVS